MPLSDNALQDVLRMIIKAEPYRKPVINEISDDFLEFTVRFFKDVAYAKLEGMGIDEDWYKRYFLEGDFVPSQKLVYAGLNDKTVLNVFGSSSQKVILRAAPEYYDELLHRVDALIDREFAQVRFALTIKYNDFSVELNLKESLIVINVLGAKHAEIRGAAWSRLGKRLEIPLMLTLARLYEVPRDNYAGKGLSAESRDVDFQFLDKYGNSFRCEVKLVGKGNPESSDSPMARRSNIMVAHTLSSNNKRQLTDRGHHWIELRKAGGYKKAYEVLSYLKIPCVEFDGDLDTALDEIIPAVFEEIT